MSPTPETDAFYNGPCTLIRSRRQRSFARKLERERNECFGVANIGFRKINDLREVLQFIATNKNANAADMRYRAARALESFSPELL